MRANFLLPFAGLLVHGCVSSSQGIAHEAPAWKVGETTRRQVVAAWGNPDFVAGDDWVWWNVESIGGKLRIAYMGVGLTVANSRRDLRECRLRFDEKGALAAMELTETMPGGPKWSVLPDE